MSSVTLGGRRRSLGNRGGRGREGLGGTERILRLAMLAQDDYPHRIVGCWRILSRTWALLGWSLAKAPARA
jgi:hypothetical protein